MIRLYSVNSLYSVVNAFHLNGFLYPRAPA
jgi:hypothetical protein